jgi:hypothetical protein
MQFSVDSQLAITSKEETLSPAQGGDNKLFRLCGESVTLFEVALVFPA